MGLAAAYKRWRHGRGFGVHSPYAFRMVSDVLRLPSAYAYYQYHDIARERSRLRAPVTLDEAFLIFRLVVEFNPRRVAVLARGPLERLLRTIVRLALPSAVISHDMPFGQRSMVIAFDPLPSALPDGTDAYLTAGALASLPAALPYGHIYRSPRRAVFAARPHLPFQIFDIKM